MSLYGEVTIAGIGGSLAYAGWAAGVDHNVTEVEITDEADVKEHMDGNGEILGFRVAHKRRRITINATPSGTVSDDAKEAMQLPDIPSKITLADFVAPTANPTTKGPMINGDWVYLGGGSLSFNDDVPRLRLPLVQFISSTKTATQLTTAVAS